MECVFSQIKYLADELSKVTPGSITVSKTYTIDCSILPKMGEEDNCTTHPDLIHIFSELKSITNPALYWFEIVSDHSAKTLHGLLPELVSKIDRTIPAYRKGFQFWDSRVLYVGKVKSKISDRLVLHLGYGKNNQTQGLQLCHWEKELNLKLQMNIIILPESLRDIAGVLETGLAKNLRPILGKHK